MTALHHARLIVDGPASGAWNMAVDEVLLAAAQHGQTTLRFYQWSPATLSLGYFQAAGDRQLHEASRACPLVRRTTGGGAILHDRELTYSICLPCRERFSAFAESVYDAFHDSLVELLAEKGIRARRCEQSDPSRESNFLCFERRARGDVLVDSWKIAGSAQRRHGGALLQHGSLLLTASNFASHLPGLTDLSGQALTSEKMAAEWGPRVAGKLGLAFSAGTLSTAEAALARETETSRYSTEGWNRRR